MNNGTIKFQKELTELINKHSIENESSTPDYLLGIYLLSCLENYNQTIKARDKWFGIDDMFEHCMKRDYKPVDCGNIID